MREAFNARIDEMNPIDIVFLEVYERPMICMLHEQNKHRYLVTYIVDSRTKSLSPGPWKQQQVDVTSRILLPISKPWRGVIVFGTTSITYIEEGRVCQSLVMKETVVTSTSKIDARGTRFLVGDTRGCLHVLILIVNDKTNAIDGLALEYLGNTTIASALCFLDSSYVFVGSCFGDSQLVQLQNKTPGSSDSAVRIVSSSSGIGPVLDMCVVSTQLHGQSQVYPCCTILI